MSDTQMRELARRGAMVRVLELETELNQIRQMFPDSGIAQAAADGTGAEDLNAPASRLKPASSEAEQKKRGWSAASRAAMSVRQKALWAKRKADAAAKVKKPRGRPPKNATA